MLVSILVFCIKYRERVLDESKTYSFTAVRDWLGIKDASVNYNFHIISTKLAAGASV
jgi:hypothetical protein